MRQGDVGTAMGRVSDDEGSSAPAPTFSALFDEAYVPMVRLAHLLTGSNEIGEEIAQEAFVSALQRYDQLDNPGAYIRRSVINGCHSWHRKQGAEQRALLRAEPPREASPAQGDELADALSGLPFRQRAALILRFYEDRSTEGIAEALGCRPGTAKSLVSRGLAQLREVIER